MLFILQNTLHKMIRYTAIHQFISPIGTFSEE